MANTFKQVIPTANRKKTEKSYEFTHITTQSFMQACPIAIREVVPNMTLKMGLESFTRLQPLVKPTFGRARVFNRLFFVPLRTIFPNIVQFLESEPIYSQVDNQFGLQTTVPLVSNNALLALLNNAHNSNAGSLASNDYTYLDSHNTVQYRILTANGKFALKLFTSLGYKINYNEADTHAFSALPLLAYAKVFIDWYYPSQYINNTLISQITPYFESDSLTARYLTSSVIQSIVSVCQYVSYDDSLLVDAWDRPSAPANGTESTYVVRDTTFPNPITDQFGGAEYVSGGARNNISNNTPYNYAQTDDSERAPIAVTQMTHDVLKALTDYTTRHRLAGVRAVDRYLAEFGINLSSEIMKRSVLLGSDEFHIQFGDVMAHSDTFDSDNQVGARLGDFAGKGIGFGSKTFSYDLGNEYGYLIVVNSVIPQVGYYQGCNPLVEHKSILDFWHGDFDGLGTTAIPQSQVYVPNLYDSRHSVVNIHDAIFGFAPRYYEYKTAPDVVSGAFQLPGASRDLQAMTLFRDLEPLFRLRDTEHDVDFVRGVDANQYNRIFYAEKEDIDNFQFIHHFVVQQVDETAPLYETYDFKEVKNAVEVHTQAAKVN